MEESTPMKEEAKKKSTSNNQFGHDGSAQVTPHDSPALSPEDAGDEGIKASAHAQDEPQTTLKRRRTSRACDECRRKKIKCDGKQPCTHCTVYGYECTYDQPSNRRRNTAPQYIEALEKQLALANRIIKSVIPGADLSDTALEEKLQQGLLTVSPSIKSPESSIIENFPSQHGGEIPTDAQLESMVRSTGQLDLDETGHLEYHGHSSGLSFVKRMREQLGDMMGPSGQGTPFVKSRPMSQVFDSPRSAVDSPWENGLDLPTREEARALCDNAIEDGGGLLRVVHYPSFLNQLDRIYNIPHEDYGNEENVFLPLLYSVLALGHLFARHEDGDELDRKGYELAIAEGFKYFRLARSMMDIADCRDLRQIQALVYMILFLQASAKLSTCYAYIGVAIRSAIRMGLHRSFSDSGFSPIESETRKRVFWVIQRMDVYVGAMLGLPHALSEDDIDQELPVEVDDQYITDSGILRQPEGHVAIMAACNAHVRLVQILDKIVRYVYPVKSSSASTQDGTLKSYSVSYAKILEIERDLKDWQDKLPMNLKPGGEAPFGVTKLRYLLRMGYAHAQMMLYRPFLHYVSHTCKSRVVDKRSYACAAACVSVSRNIVHIACEMKRRHLLVGAYWFTMYTTFFAILSLVFYALENPDNDASQDVLRVATEGKETLQQLNKRSMAADRCSATLQALFQQLPERMKRTRHGSLQTKKRKQDSGQGATNHSSKSILKNEFKPPARASTFPHIRSRSVDRASSVAVSNGNPQPAATGLANTHANNFYDLIQANNSNQFMTPPLSSAARSTTQGSGLTSPEMLPAPQFPLADLSSVMFPSADPVEYPNQNTVGGQPYEDILKDLACDPTFPFPGSIDELRMQRAMGSSTFVPPSSTFIGKSSDSNDLNSMYDTDMQLFGPMPAYMMQGPSMATTAEGLTNNLNEPLNTSNDFTSQFLVHQGRQYLNNSSLGSQITANPSAPPTSATSTNTATMDLDQLLSGEDWSSLGDLGSLSTNMESAMFSQNSAFGGPKSNNTNPLAMNGMMVDSTRSSLENVEGQRVRARVSFDDFDTDEFWNMRGT